MTNGAILETVVKSIATNTINELAGTSGATTSKGLDDISIFDIAKTFSTSNGNLDLTEQVCSGLGKVAGTAMGGPAGGIIGSLLGKYVLAPISKAANKIQTALIDTVANGIGKLVGNIFGEK